MRHQLSLRPLQLAHHEISQLQRLVQAHRTPQVIARRAQLILTAHAHPDSNTNQIRHKFVTGSTKML